MQDRYFSDEELVAFLDGENDLAPVDAIASAMKDDAALRARIDALVIDRDAIADSFAAMLPPQDAVPEFSVPVANRRKFAVQTLAAACFALVIGVGVGTWMTPQKTAGWTEYVAAYQALYSNSTLAHINQTPEAKQVELDRVATSIGKTIPVAVLEQFPEIEYKRAQVLSFEGRPLIQLAFLTSTGEPLALCIIRSDADRTTAPSIAKMENLSAASWTSDAHAYFLIGGRDDALVSRLADAFVTLEL